MTKPHGNSMCLAKSRLDWAAGRIKEFHDSAQSFLDSGVYSRSIHKQVEPDGSLKFTVGFISSADPPFVLSALAGEIVHTLRSTVDNLVWSVAQTCPVDKRLSLVFKEGATAFAHYASITKLDRLPRPLYDWYENEQPHKRPDGRPSLLHLLTKLWNEDKHRVPLLMGSAVPVGFIQSGNVKCFTIIGSGVMKHGDKICEITVVPEEVANLKIRFAVDVGFKEGCIPSARTFLLCVENHIRHEVLPQFEPFLT